jgi:hypothetical protein
MRSVEGEVEGVYPSLRMRKSGWCWLMLCFLGCAGAPQPLSPPLPEAASRASYCERLQPLLDKTTEQARIGTKLSCLDVPGVTALGRFGPPSSAEEATLADCFEQSADYEALSQSPEAPFQLAISDSFEQTSGSGVGASLSSLVPWLPHFEVSSKTGARIAANVTIREARFVTLVGLASKLQGQAREARCLEALCKPEYSYVHKVLVGVPTVSVSARDESGHALSVGPLAGNLEFHERQLQEGSREISSAAPVTLAIARTPFRTPQTERLCQFCGKRGQKCCADAPACDGGLGCISEQCIEVGGPGQPCDGSSCAGGSMCVAGECHLECGGKGQPCCGRNCTGALHCAADPESGGELPAPSQFVRVDGGLLGTDEDRTFGNSSCGALSTRSRFAVTALNATRAQCDKAWWFDPKNDKDCRIGVHFSVSSLASLACRVDLFVNPPPKPDICQP